ncbi:MAG: hypothetical protein LBU64_00720 [Planctomycetota bacterium]|nr:hypothetical protein [Planctomycetota bacterium]
MDNKRESVVTGNNDIELAVTKNGVQVSITPFEEWSDRPEGRFTLDEWVKAMTEWRKFLSMPKSLDCAVEFEL